MTVPRPAGTRTRAAQRAAAGGPESSDWADFDDAVRALVAPLPDGGHIAGATGAAVWDASRYASADGAGAPDTVHPCLGRQPQLPCLTIEGDGAAWGGPLGVIEPPARWFAIVEP